MVDVQGWIDKQNVKVEEGNQKIAQLKEERDAIIAGNKEVASERNSKAFVYVVIAAVVIAIAIWNPLNIIV
jgi:hypothetical protein